MTNRRNSPARLSASRLGAAVVRLRLKEKTYEICIGPGEISRLNQALERAAHASGKQDKNAFLVSDRALLGIRKKVVRALKASGWNVHEIAVDAGEGLKDFSSIYPIYADLLKLKADRNATLFAIGGGSVGDAAGFIAATYLRGVAWVGVPTTLLAQVDSSIGGKTGINHDAGKNLIGSFHQPRLVVCDTDFLMSLSKREMISGLGEILKYGLVYDPKMLKYTAQNIELVLGHDRVVLTKLIERSLHWKARVVAQDEFDRKGVREALNFGHTFGHALESITKYKIFQHGEAVIWGMRFAVALSFVRGALTKRDFDAACKILSLVEVPNLPSRVTMASYIELMANDKKMRGGRLHFVLLKRIGKTISDSGVTPADLARAYELMRERL
jgi:3-dehydroquinate synthase